MAMYTMFKDFIEQCNVQHIRLATHICMRNILHYRSNFFKTVLYSILDLDYDVCHIIANKLVQHGDCKFSLKTFALAVAKIRRTRSTLTPVHTDLCMLSLKAKYFKYALGCLRIDTTAISTGSETRINYVVSKGESLCQIFSLYFYNWFSFFFRTRTLTRSTFWGTFITVV